MEHSLFHCYSLIIEAGGRLHDLGEACLFYFKERRMGMDTQVKAKRLYQYEVAVLIFDRVVANKFTAQTMAKGFAQKVKK